MLADDVQEFCDKGITIKENECKTYVHEMFVRFQTKKTSKCN